MKHFNISEHYANQAAAVTPQLSGGDAVTSCGVVTSPELTADFMTGSARVSHSGPAGNVRGRGQRAEPDLCRHQLPGGAQLHLLVSRRPGELAETKY